MRRASLAASVHCQELLHARARERRIDEKARRVREAEELRKMLDVPRGLLPAHHDEVILVAVQPRHEHHPRLIEARRRAEDVARERHSRREDLVVVRFFISCEKRKRL